MVSGLAAATVAGAGGPARPPTQVLSDLFDALAVLLAEVNPTNQDEHNAEIAKVKDHITQAKVDLAAEDTRMAAERAELDAQAYRLMLDQSTSNDVMRIRYRSHSPPVYEARNLFDTPGAGTSNPPVVNRRRHRERERRFSRVRWTRLIRTMSCRSTSQRLRVITLTRWIT